jgi:20S proteasome alpha/beta subunit
MSLVIALRDDEGVIHMASDSRASTPFIKTDYDVCKVGPTEDGDLLIGFVGEMCLGELQYYSYLPTVMPSEQGEEMNEALAAVEDIYRDSITEHDFISSVKYSIADTVFQIKCAPEGDNPHFNGSLLLAFRDQLYLMGGDYSILPVREDWAVIGSGQYHATSVMKIFEQYKDSDPLDILVTAIKIASDSVLSVGGKIYYTNTEDCEVVELDFKEAVEETTIKEDASE